MAQTREDKIKELLLYSEGIKQPKDDRVFIWNHWQDDCYKTGIDNKLIELNEKQFNAFTEKVGGKHIVMTLTKDCEPLYITRKEYESLSDEIPKEAFAIRPEDQDQAPVIQQPKAIPETITQDIQAEITGQAKEHEPIPQSEPAIIIGSIKPQQKIKVDFEELEWADADPIGYMFPKRR